MISSFPIRLTRESIAAREQALQTTASDWEMKFFVSQNEGKKAKKMRSFKSIGATLKRKRAPQMEKARKSKKDKSPKKKKNKKTKKEKRIRLKPLQGSNQPIEVVQANFGRSEKGRRLIKQEMESMKLLDLSAFPSRPAFDSDFRCRLTIANVEGVHWDEIVKKAPAYFNVIYRERSRAVFAKNVYDAFQQIRSQLSRVPPVRKAWLELLKKICEMPSVD